MERPLWERLPGEPLESFTHFQLYKTLGTHRGRRSVRAAYRTLMGLPKGSHAPESWWADYRRFEWKRRAQAYDASLIAEVGERAAAKFAALIDLVLDNALRAASGPATAPTTYAEMMGFLREFTQIVPAATLAALSARSRLLRDGGGGDGGDGGPELLAELPECSGPVHEGDPWNQPLAQAEGDREAPPDPSVPGPGAGVP